MYSPTGALPRFIPIFRHSLHAAALRLLLAAVACVLALLVAMVQPAPMAGQTDKKEVLTDEKLAFRLGLSIEDIRMLMKERGFSRERLSQWPLDHLPTLHRKLGHTDQQRKRAAFRALFLQGEKGDIPDWARFKAIERAREMDKIAKNDKRKRVAGVHVDAPAPSQSGMLPTGGGAGKWESLGPTNVGGRTRAIVVHPTNPDVMYAGCVSGGIWKTTNGGQSWYPLTDVLGNLAVCSIAMDPTNPDILFAGTGEGWANVDYIAGGGLYKTTDGGASWTQMTINSKTMPSPSFQFIDRLVFSPDGKVLMAAVGAGDYRIDPAHLKKDDPPPPADAGIWITTNPEKTQWRLVKNGQISCIAFDPRDKSKAIASAMGKTRRSGDAYWSADGGNSWTLAPQSDNWLGRVELCYAATNSSIVYACVDQPGSQGQIWRSTDGGRNYTRMQGKTAAGQEINFMNNQGWYANVIWAGDPTNSNLVIVGGLDLWRSTDGGNTFAQISYWDRTAEGSPHADHHVIVSHANYDGRNNRTVFVGCDGGIYRAANITSCGTDANLANGWSKVINNYVTAQFYGVAGHAKAGFLYAGAQDNGNFKLNLTGGQFAWTPIPKSGDGGYCAVDQDDPSYAYGEYTNLAVYRIPKDGVQATDYLAGFYWDYAKKQGVRRPAPYHIPEAKSPWFEPNAKVQSNFIAPFILDPNNQQRMLAGGASLWVTDDVRTPTSPTKGPTWKQLKPPPVAAEKAGYISAIAVAKGDSNVIWVGHNGSNIYVSRNALNVNPQWTRVDLALPNRPVTRIVIDEANYQHAFVTFGGYSANNVFETLDSGKNWRDISAKMLPVAPCRGLAMHPRRPDYLYLATEVGVYLSEDGGKSWRRTSDGPTHCRVDELAWMGETLVAATHGRGLFRVDLSQVE
jgi:photosystem II stability/assembly factor-like uncharacterized protein